MLETLALAEQGKLVPEKQKDEEGTYARMLTKEMGELDFSMEAERLERYVRGLNSWPGAYTFFHGKRLKIWRAAAVSEDTKKACGTVVRVEKDGFCVQTGKGLLKLLEVQPEGKKRMSTADFMRGNQIENESF